AIHEQLDQPPTSASLSRSASAPRRPDAAQPPVTVSVPFIPSWSWPFSLHRNVYSPAASVTVAPLVDPAAIASTLLITWSPCRISSSCSCVPTFLIEKVTEPAGTVIIDGVNAYSFASMASTPDGTGVTVLAVGVVPLPQAANTAARARGATRRVARRAAMSARRPERSTCVVLQADASQRGRSGGVSAGDGRWRRPADEWAIDDEQ